MATRNPHRATIARGRSAVVALVALLAFLCQSFVTQTHLHLDPAARAVALAGPAGTTLKAGSPSRDLPDCPICREISHGGSYLPTMPVAFQATAPAPVWRVVLPPRALAPSQYSHAWRSRAPPLLLHA